MHTDIIKTVGNFIDNSSTSEVDFSLRFRNEGFKTCYLIGSGLSWNSSISAYSINNDSRWWDYNLIGVELAQLVYILTHLFELNTWIIIWNLITGKI